MSLVLFKLLAAGLVLLTGLAGGLIVFRLEESRRAALFFSLGSASAGGIFLGAGLIHLLPDAQAGFRAVWPNLEYPVAFLAAAAGFGLILLIERVIFGLDESEAGETAAAHGPAFAYVLTLVLSIHSILAGTALGAEDTLIGSVVILLAVVGHKGSAAFALATSLIKAKVGRGRMAGIIILFSAMTPLGILAGSGINDWLTGRENHLFEACFDALAAGSFFYIAALDIINEEFSQPPGLAVKFGLFLIGLAVMALLALWL